MLLGYLLWQSNEIDLHFIQITVLLKPILIAFLIYTQELLVIAFNLQANIQIIQIFMNLAIYFSVLLIGLLSCTHYHP